MFLKIARWVPASGIVFAVLVVVSWLLTTDRPGTGASDASVTAYYADGSNRTKELVAMLLVGLAGLCFLSFLGSVRGLFARAEGEPARLTTAAAAAGAVFIALSVAAHVFEAAVAASEEYYDTFAIDPNTAKLMLGIAFGFLVMGMFAAAAMTLAATVLALHTNALPRWLSILGGLATVAGIVTFFLPPVIIITLAWIVALSAWMPVPRTGQVPATAPTMS